MRFRGRRAHDWPHLPHPTHQAAALLDGSVHLHLLRRVGVQQYAQLLQPAGTDTSSDLLPQSHPVPSLTPSPPILLAKGDLGLLPW